MTRTLGALPGWDHKLGLLFSVTLSFEEGKRIREFPFVRHHFSPHVDLP